MSGVSHYVVKERPPLGQLSGHDWRKQGNPPPSNYFKTREMNVNECASYNDYPYPEYYEYEPVGYYCTEPSEYFYGESGYYVNDQPNYELEYSDEYHPESPKDPQPSTSSAEEQDFPKRGKSDRSNRIKPSMSKTASVYPNFRTPIEITD